MTAEPRDLESPEVSGPGEEENPLWRSRPRLRHDVLFADTGSGVLLRHADASFVLRGRAAYRFFSAVAPFLDGGVTVAELAEAIPSQQRPMLLDLVGTLLERGFARDSRPAPEGALDERTRSRFQRQIDYVEHYADGAVERFARFRDLRVLVAGDGPVAEWAALGLIRNGAGSVDTAGTTGPARALLEEAKRLEADGCPVALRATDLDASTVSGKDLSGYDLVLLATDGLSDVWRLCADEDAPALLPAVVLDAYAVAGPLNVRGTDSCWNCALLRFTEAGGDTVAARIWRGLHTGDGPPAGAWTSDTQAAMVGNALAFEAFRWATGVLEGETLEAALIQDLRTLDSSSERVLPHPRCPNRHGIEAREVPTLAQVSAEPEDDESVGEAYRAAEALVGARLGVVREYLDLDLSQSPLKVGRVGFAGHGDPRIARADVHTTLRARLRTMRAAALRRVGSDAVTVPLAGAGTPVRLASDRIATATGAPAAPKGPFAHGVGLVGGDVHEVPVAAVHPFSGFNADGAFERTVGGEGAGSTLAHAVHEALLSAGAFDALRRAVAGDPAVRVEPPRPPRGSELEFLSSVAQTLDMTVELLRLTGPVPVFIARDSAAGTWALGHGASPAKAVTAALRDLVARVQLAEHGITDEEAADTWLAAFDPRSLTVAAGVTRQPLDEACVGADEVCRALSRDGREAVAVPTSTPDLERCGVHTARVLLTTPGASA